MFEAHRENLIVKASVEVRRTVPTLSRARRRFARQPSQRNVIFEGEALSTVVEGGGFRIGR
jgi:hypothetical protein